MKLFELEDKCAVVTGGAQRHRRRDRASSSQRRRRSRDRQSRPVRLRRSKRASGWRRHRRGGRRGGVRGIAEQLGGIDILVNNAGRAIRKPATELPREEWQQVIDLNLDRALPLLARRALPSSMKTPRRRLDRQPRLDHGLLRRHLPERLVPGEQGRRGEPHARARARVGGDNIRVNAVAPTFVRTDLTVPIFSTRELVKRVMRHTPLGRLPEPDDIAAAIVYLCEPGGALHHRHHAAGRYRLPRPMSRCAVPPRPPGSRIFAMALQRALAAARAGDAALGGAGAALHGRRRDPLPRGAGRQDAARAEIVCAGRALLVLLAERAAFAAPSSPLRNACFRRRRRRFDVRASSAAPAAFPSGRPRAAACSPVDELDQRSSLENA